MAKHLVFDTETTGLIRNTLVRLEKQPEIFEFFGVSVDMDTLELGEELHVFAKPTKKMDDGAKKATGKDDSFFVDFEPFSSNAEKIKSFIESHDAVVAHNLMYDFNVINFEFKRIGIDIKWPRLICTLEKTEFIKGYRISNTDLFKYLFEGEDFDNKHEARADVLALARSYIELVKRGIV